MKQTKLISAFPGVGKTYFMQNNKDIKILDSDSSDYHFEINDDGQKVQIKGWQNNYINHLKEQIEKKQWDFILVSSHEIIRKKLARNFIKHYVVYPNERLKQEYLQRYRNRGSDQNFIKLLNDNFENWIEQIDLEFYFQIATKIKIQMPNTYLNDIFRAGAFTKV